MYGHILVLSMFVALSGVETPVVVADKETCFEETGSTAIAACTRLIESEDFTANSLAVIYYNRGVSWYEMGQYNRAIQDYDEAIKLNPNFAQAVFSRGNANDAERDYDDAIDDYDRAIALDPSYAKAFNNRGYVWDEKHEFDRAIRDYDRAIAINPRYAQAFNNRGIAYLNKSDYDRAIHDFDQAIELEPGYAAAFYNRGVAKLKCGKIRDGNADLAAAKAANPAIGR